MVDKIRRMRSAHITAALLIAVIAAAVLVVTREREVPQENREEVTENEVAENIIGYAMEPGQSVSYTVSFRENIFGSCLDLTGLFGQSAIGFENFLGETVMRWEVWENLAGSLTAGADGATVSIGYGLTATGHVLVDNRLRIRHMATQSEIRIEGQEDEYGENMEITVDYENMKIAVRKGGAEDVQDIASVLLDVPTCLVILRENLGVGYQKNFALRVLAGLPVGVTLTVEGSEAVDTPVGRFDCWTVSGGWKTENVEIRVSLLVSKRMEVVVGGSVSFWSLTEYGVITLEQAWTLREASWLLVAG
jgi:hypothetical protein